MMENKKNDTEHSISLKGAKPNFTLCSEDKFYLAVALKHTEKLSLVYTLSCPVDSCGKFNLQPITEQHSFVNPKKADIYYHSIKEFMNFQRKMKLADYVHQTFADLVNNFYERTR